MGPVNDRKERIIVLTDGSIPTRSRSQLARNSVLVSIVSFLVGGWCGSQRASRGINGQFLHYYYHFFFLHLISIDDLFRPNQELVTKVTAKHHGCTRCVSRAFSTRKSSRVLSLSPLPLCPPSKVSESQGLIGSVRLHQGGLPEVSGLRETLQRQVEDIFIAEPDTLSKRERKRERERERIARAEKKKGWGWEEKDGEGGAHIIQDYFATRRFPILGKHLTLNHRHIDRNALYSKAIREGCYMYSKYKDDTRINFRR